MYLKSYKYVSIVVLFSLSRLYVFSQRPTLVVVCVVAGVGFVAGVGIGVTEFAGFAGVSVLALLFLVLLVLMLLIVDWLSE